MERTVTVVMELLLVLVVLKAKSQLLDLHQSTIAIMVRYRAKGLLTYIITKTILLLFRTPPEGTFHRAIVFVQ